uniref:Integrase catalytic domain-containing protein n=1 Tax=Leptobrachium leishanense TaxID=445787 RepID=A0A8C5WDC9_9ANUR
MKVETLLCLNAVFQDQPKVDFYMNNRRFAPHGEFIEDVLCHWYGEYELLEKHHRYIQWLFPLREQGRNEHAKPLTFSEIEIMKNTAEIQHRLRRAYKLMLNFFGVKIVGEEEIEVIRDSNFSTHFSNLNTNTHNNLRITRIVKSMGELGAAQYQAPLVKFFLKEILVEDQLQNMKESALKYSLPAVKNDHERDALSEYVLKHRISKNTKRLLPVVTSLLPTPITHWTPAYSEKEKKWLSEEPGEYREDGWYQLENERIVLPATLAPEIVRALHSRTHGGKTAMEQQLEPYFYVPGLTAICKAIAHQCVTHAKNNPRQGIVRPPGVLSVELSPMSSLQIDFTVLPPCKGYKYLLVLVCTLTGWVEAYPTRTEKTAEIVGCLMREIIPRYGLPLEIGSDNGPAFVQSCLQQLARLLRILWKLHTTYRSQSSGKVERMNKDLDG